MCISQQEIRKGSMASFTPTQGRYLAFIYAYTSLHGYPPAESEIAAAMCVSPPSVNQMVKALEKKGLILRHPGQPRSLQILIPEEGCASLRIPTRQKAVRSERAQLRN
jgi:DNA-binding MarR family transcriptional regulator